MPTELDNLQCLVSGVLAPPCGLGCKQLSIKRQPGFQEGVLPRGSGTLESPKVWALWWELADLQSLGTQPYRLS